MIDLDRLERLAALATPRYRGEDREFLAACDPATVATLVRAVKAAEFLCEGARGFLTDVLVEKEDYTNLREALAPFRSDE